MFQHINRSGEQFIYMVPDTYYYTKLFGLWKNKGSRMKPYITKNCPRMEIGGMKGNCSSEHLIVVKSWMKTNKLKEQPSIWRNSSIKKD